MITEEEARKKWCPLARHPWEGVHGACAVNDMSVEYSDCVASDCMMWRWDGDSYEYCTMDNREPDETKPGWLRAKNKHAPKPRGERWVATGPERQKSNYVPGIMEREYRRLRKEERRGRCGLAGE